MDDTGQSYNIKIANKSFESVAKFRFLRMTAKNKT
jgi:hypothetical protein